MNSPAERASTWRPGANLELALLLLLLAFVALVGFNSLQRSRSFSPDSMNYVTVAREVSAGRGLVQPTLGFNQPFFAPDAEIPTPFTTQAPLFPLAIAFLARLGFSHEDAALVLPVVGFGFVLLLSFAVANRLYGRAIAWLSLTLLLLMPPLRQIAGVAWSESMGLSLVLLACWFLLRGTPFAGGCAAGLAFATRYALLPAALAAGLCLIWRAPAGGRRWSDLLRFGAGFLLPAGTMLARNIWLTGHALPTANPSEVGFAQNLLAGLQALAASFLGGVHDSLAEACLLGFVFLALSCQLWLRRDSRPPVSSILAGPRLAPVIWAGAYLGFLIIQRSLSHFDVIGPRLVAPAAVALALPLAALAVLAWPRLQSWTLPLCGLVVILNGLRETETLLDKDVLVTSSARLAASERLLWLQRYAHPQDLVIGNDSLDVAFYIGRTPVVSFSPFPYSNRPTYESVRALARARCGRQRAIILVMRRDEKTEEQWQRDYGAFFTDLAVGRLGAYPDIVPVIQLGDARVYRFVCNR